MKFFWQCLIYIICCSYGDSPYRMKLICVMNLQEHMSQTLRMHILSYLLLDKIQVKQLRSPTVERIHELSL